MTAAVIDEGLPQRPTRCGTALHRGARHPQTRSDNGCISETLDRRGLYQAQTPQCFELGKLLAGYEKLLFEGGAHGIPGLTDDAQVYERMGWAVKMTTGTSLNVKITTGDDVAFARALIAAIPRPDEQSQGNNRLLPAAEIALASSPRENQ